LFKLSCFFSF